MEKAGLKFPLAAFQNSLTNQNLLSPFPCLLLAECVALVSCQRWREKLLVHEEYD
jgi:hypothetical protein